MNYLAEENGKEVQIHKKGNGQQKGANFFFFIKKKRYNFENNQPGNNRITHVPWPSPSNGEA
jgi:hypothetical protein